MAKKLDKRVNNGEKRAAGKRRKRSAKPEKRIEPTIYRVFLGRQMSKLSAECVIYKIIQVLVNFCVKFACGSVGLLELNSLFHFHYICVFFTFQ